ncbi:MAG: SDR family NAD(P)-dependent oxidoreductase [Candidatus Gastranaerophilales bacterium]|nr:SDR family NAD(P)-dependent oxidoreductase [Candidatus Gastranaerophilales bacterium]
MTKTALITGSSSGIGAQIAFVLSQKGYDVFLTGRNEEKLKKQAQKCNSEYFLAGDLCDDNFCQKLINEVVKKTGSIDILVNNAGEYIWSPIEKTEKEKISQLFKINLHAPYLLTNLAIPQMKKQKWGRIINIGSISGAVGEANATLYSASKAGLTGLTKSLALEVAEFGITVNQINPGWVKTALSEEVFENGTLNEQEQLDMIPQKRWITPSEIADAVCYFISDSAQGITGQSLNLCAGLSLG